MGKKVLILLADGFEEIEAVASIDILRRAGQDVKAAGIGGMAVTGSHGIGINADVEINSCGDLPDAVVIPGGMPGAQNVIKSPKAVSLIKEAYRKGRVIAAICAAPAYVLAPLGILDGRKAVCYPGCEGRFGQKTTYVDEDIVVDGNVITGRGPAAAAAFALKITEELCGEKIARSIKEKL